MSRRVFLKTFVGTTLVGTSIVPVRFLLAQDVPPEPDNLDEPTAWQEGDPEPMEMQVPTVEPEQQSDEDPPSQPMDDDRGDPPSPDHNWVYGYWWWTNGEYVWVPGYWEIPPKSDYEYEPGYWKHGNNPWIKTGAKTGAQSETWYDATTETSQKVIGIKGGCKT